MVFVLSIINFWLSNFKILGIIPRAISLLFQEFQNRSDRIYEAYVSYVEIYNEQVYDLVDPNTHADDLEDLPRVTLRESGKSRIIEPWNSFS